MLELVERDVALKALQRALLDAARGRGSVALVSGEPGIGKSALVTSFIEQHADGARVLWGLCDDLATPRPLGAFRDVAAVLSGPLAESLSAGSTPATFHTLLLHELRSSPAPIVLVLEDVQWADQATIDALTVVGRRLADLPVLLIVTFRPGEVSPGHQLRTAIDAMQRTTTLSIDLAPLSRDAVATLVSEDADRIFEVTGGNPFFVVQMLAHQGDRPPPSLANAVLGRVSRLESPSRELLELVSMVPTRVSTRADVGGLVRTEGPDVLLLQEVTAPLDAQLRAELEDELPHAWFGPDTRWGGVGVLSRYPIVDVRPLARGEHFERPTAVVTLEVPLDGTTRQVQIVPLHLVAACPICRPFAEGQRREVESRDTEFRAVLAALDPDLPAVVGGDLNGDRRADPYRRLTDAGFRDPHREVGTGLGFTFPDRRPSAPVRTRSGHRRPRTTPRRCLRRTSRWSTFPSSGSTTCSRVGSCLPERAWARDAPRTTDRLLSTSTRCRRRSCRRSRFPVPTMLARCRPGTGGVSNVPSGNTVSW